MSLYAFLVSYITCSRNQKYSPFGANDSSLVSSQVFPNRVALAFHFVSFDLTQTPPKAAGPWMLVHRVVCPFTPQLSLLLINRPRSYITLSWCWYTAAVGKIQTRDLRPRDHKSGKLVKKTNTDKVVLLLQTKIHYIRPKILYTFWLSLRQKNENNTSSSGSWHSK